MREDGKAVKTVYVGNGVKSVELVEPKKKDSKPTESNHAEAKHEKVKKD